MNFLSNLSPSEMHQSISTQSRNLKRKPPIKQILDCSCKHCILVRVTDMSYNKLTYNIDGLVQERCNSIANALELHHYCTNSSICTFLIKFILLSKAIPPHSAVIPLMWCGEWCGEWAFVTQHGSFAIISPIPPFSTKLIAYMSYVTVFRLYSHHPLVKPLMSVIASLNDVSTHLHLQWSAEDGHCLSAWWTMMVSTGFKVHLWYGNM